MEESVFVDHKTQVGFCITKTKKNYVHGLRFINFVPIMFLTYNDVVNYSPGGFCVSGVNIVINETWEYNPKNVAVT